MDPHNLDVKNVNRDKSMHIIKKVQEVISGVPSCLPSKNLVQTRQKFASFFMKVKK